MSDINTTKTKIRVLGIGNAGVALLKKLNQLGCHNAELVAIDTDLKTLNDCALEHIFPCGGNLTDNMGCGGDAALAKDAALANIARLKSYAENAEIVIILTSLGGGTGSVIAPIMSKLACEGGAKCVLCFSILPLSIEGTARAGLAQKALAYLKKHSNASISLPNDIILAPKKTPLKEAFDAANACAAKAVLAMLEMLEQKGVINIDYASFYKIFEKRNVDSFFAFGGGMGENAIDDAVEDLKDCPLLANKIPHAENMLINIVCGESLEMNRAQLLLESLKLNFDARGRVGFGVVVNHDFDSRIEICAIGTNLEELSNVDVSVKTERVDATPMPTQDKPNIENPTTVSNENISVAGIEQFSDNVKSAKLTAPQGVSSEILKAPHRRATTWTPEKPAVQPPTQVANPPFPVPQPAPVPAVEEQPKKRKGFFSFGRKSVPEKEQNQHAKQEEFVFVDKSQQRGFFADTQPNMRNDEDLDVPTFIRRNIKINL